MPCMHEALGSSPSTVILALRRQKHKGQEFKVILGQVRSSIRRERGEMGGVGGKLGLHT